MNTQYILDNSDLLIKEDCKIIDDVLYEKCKFDDKLFTKNEFINNDRETYRLNDNNHVYRYFTSVYDYDYVCDEDLIKKLDEIFTK